MVGGLVVAVMAKQMLASSRVRSMASKIRNPHEAFFWLLLMIVIRGGLGEGSSSCIVSWFEQEREIGNLSILLFTCSPFLNPNPNTRPLRDSGGASS